MGNLSDLVKKFCLYTDVKYNANLVVKNDKKGNRYEAKRYDRAWVVREHLFSVATSRLASIMIAERFERLGFFLKFHERVCYELKQKENKSQSQDNNVNDTETIYTKKLSEFGDIGIDTSDYACQGFTQSALVSSGINDKFIDSTRPNWGIADKATKRLRFNFYTGIANANLSNSDVPSLCFKVIAKGVQSKNDGSVFVRAKIQYFESLKRLRNHRENDNKTLYELNINFSIKKATIRAFNDIKNNTHVGVDDFSGVIDNLSDNKYWSGQVAELSNKGIAY